MIAARIVRRVLIVVQHFAILFGTLVVGALLTTLFIGLIASGPNDSGKHGRDDNAQ